MAFDPTKYEGAGHEDLDSSSAMPIIRILQDQSPEINPRKENHIAGSKAGDLFWNKTRSVVPSPLEFVPVACRSVYVEWKPKSDGGGVVATHPLSVTSDPRYRKDGYKEFLGSNELKYTTYWCILALINGEWENALLACTSTQLKVSRALSSEIAKFRYEGLQVTPPVFARKFKLSSVLEKNAAQQEYFNFKVTEPTVLDFERDEQLLELAGSAATAAKGELPAPQVAALTVDDSDTPY